ncbi:MAG: hypothetical protein M0P20_08100 [Methanocorpusculum sp.]|nr:hypothetical protein [Methanocorpusculum sp.]
MCNFVYDDVDSERKGVALTEGINIIGSRNIIGRFYRKGVKHYGQTSQSS